MVLVCEDSLCPRKQPDVSGPSLGEAAHYNFTPHERHATLWAISPEPDRHEPTCRTPLTAPRVRIPDSERLRADFGSRAGPVHARNGRAVIPVARTPRITPTRPKSPASSFMWRPVTPCRFPSHSHRQ